MIKFQGKTVSVVTGDLEGGWVIILLPDGTHREVRPEELSDSFSCRFNDAVLALAINEAIKCIGFSWICAEEYPPCAPCQVAGFFDEKEARLYAATHAQRNQRSAGATPEEAPLAVMTATEFLRARSRWWQQRQPKR